MHTIDELYDAFNRCFTENYIGDDDCCETCPYLSETPGCVSRVIEDVAKTLAKLKGGDSNDQASVSPK